MRLERCARDPVACTRRRRAGPRLRRRAGLEVGHQPCPAAGGPVRRAGHRHRGPTDARHRPHGRRAACPRRSGHDRRHAGGRRAARRPARRRARPRLHRRLRPRRHRHALRPAGGCLADGAVRFDGDPRARERPMGAVLEALRELGARIEGDGLPFTLHGRACRAARWSSTRRRRRSSSPGSCSPVPATTRASPSSTTASRCRRCRTSPCRSPCCARPASRWTTRSRTPGESPRPRRRPRLDGRAGPVQRGGVPRRCGGHRRGGHDRGVAGAVHAAGRRGPAGTGAVRRDGHTGPDGMSVRGPNTLQGVDVDLHDVGELTPTVAAVAASRPPSRLRKVAHLRGTRRTGWQRSPPS